MDIFTWFLCPEQIQGTLPSICHSILGENLKVISSPEKEIETILDQSGRGYVGNNPTQVFGILCYQI